VANPDPEARGSGKVHSAFLYPTFYPDHSNKLRHNHPALSKMMMMMMMMMMTTTTTMTTMMMMMMMMVIIIIIIIWKLYQENTR
jgi:hypothetical protein